MSSYGWQAQPINQGTSGNGEAKAARRSRGEGGRYTERFRQDRRKHVYIIRSVDKPAEWYVGLTSDLEARLAKHNSGGSPHTSKHRPWNLVVAITFSDDSKAVEFEKYLKSGSGRAFANKHFR